MKLSTKSRYAVRAMVDLAVHYKKEPVQIKDIAKREKLSVRYLENIFTQLRADGILNSEKGKGGGFYLSRKPTQITMLDIVQSVEGKLSIVDCVDFPSRCKKASICVSREVWQKISIGVKKILKNITLQDLIISYKKKIGASDNVLYYI